MEVHHVDLSVQFDTDGDGGRQILWGDSDRIVCRGRWLNADSTSCAVLAVLPAAEHPSAASLARLTREYELKDELDEAWAVRPLELGRERGRTMLLLQDPGGELLERLLGPPMPVERFLRLALSLAGAIAGLHRRGLIHKDIKPAHCLVDATRSTVRLTGFGIASRLPRERQAPEPPEFISGTLAYMAPEQTGRMNRSTDARSDLYSLGVTLYQMLVGLLPFTASDPMGWVHCHVARKPVAPAERLENVATPLSAIIMKLLAKTAEERYQTATGLEHDLRRCLVEWGQRRSVDDFPLGEGDIPDRLRIAEKLYGRERDVESLLAAFDRVATRGTPELVLVSGFSGIGKTSVVNELHKALVPRGLFASGKFDQYKRDIPYATIAQALQSQIRSLLARSDSALRSWRDALRETLGPNGQLIVDLVPELRLIIGDQPPVPELPPQDAQRRFRLVLRRFIGVFTRPEHPLALFLDDLQWLDAATLDLLEDLLTRSDRPHLLLIGAYRDNEVSAAHPLMRTLDAIRRAGARVQEIRLTPLTPDHVGELVADALRCEPARSAGLAALVHEKTAGNPFFLIQFLYALSEEGLLWFEHDQARWCWDVERIHAKAYTDNVVDLMVREIARLPDGVQSALQTLACLGHTAEVATLSLVQGASEEQVRADLWEAVRLELIQRSGGSYKFVHDRIQEAAYLLVSEKLRGETHLRIGRLLAAHTPPDKRQEAIFEIVNQLNRGTALMATQDEREQLAEFNLIAAKRAKASTAYASALTYLIAGAALLPEKSWECRHELTFALELHRAECEFLIGALVEAETRLAELAGRAASLADLAIVTRLRVDLFMPLGRSDRAVVVGLDYLRRVGIAWSAHPTKGEVRQEYAQMWQQLGDRSIESLLDLPPMADPVACATMDVLTSLVTPALFTDENLRALVIGRMVTISLEYGNSDASCYAYTNAGSVLGLFFGDYKAGFRFGQLGLEMVEQRGVDRLKPRVYLAFGTLAKPSNRHFPTSRPIARHALDAALWVGDLAYAAFSYNIVLTQLFASGNSLEEVQREAKVGLDFARHAKFGLVVDLIKAQFGLVRTLCGQTATFGSFNGIGFDEQRFEQRLEEDPRLTIAACLYWIRKLQALVLAGDHLAAVAAARQAEHLLWMSPAIFERADYHLYVSLAHASLCQEAPAAERARHQEALAMHHRQLQIWAEHCPENFENRAALVGAEIARLEGRDLDAERLYQQAIHSARASGFVHNEALAYEMAARFYAARGFDEFAHLYLRNARYCYVRWGADGKVRQLDQLYPQLRESEPAPGPTQTFGASVEQLDLATVLRVSQAVSGEIVLENMLHSLMRIAIEQAGAEHGVLVLSQRAGQRIAAEATTSGGTIVVHLRDQPVTVTALPEAIVQTVLRTRETMILDDATADPAYADVAYVRQRKPRSILCLPLINQSQLIGALYLENNLAPRVFTPTRISVLRLAASQAAIALENTRLYRDIAEREAKIRSLVDANIIGIFAWEYEGLITEANDAFLRIVGYDRDDLLAGRIRWTDLTPAEWLEHHEQRWTPAIRLTGSVQPYEKECFRKDGSRVPVLIGAASLNETGSQGVSFVLDLTERKRAEQALRQAHTDLAHLTRVMTMGELTASIVHEVNQPIAALAIHAGACLRWLAHQPPDLDEVRACLHSMVRESNRAGDVVTRVRALVKKSPTVKAKLDLGDAIQEVLSLVEPEARRHAVLIRTELVAGLPPVRGDRVQLQQVILNLAMNGIQAMKEVAGRPRELWISAHRHTDDTVLVSVQDTGIGLAAEDLTRVFKAFYTTKVEGMGMGLSISRSIIEAHGGQLWPSANDDYGVTFRFTVPTDEVNNSHTAEFGSVPP
jgi:PAS domain S-box-containing protein